ncbi:MAG: hypothetical protein JOZ51_21420 [Chloroflexi bacterium]|nr:hypothetical protein [Chloroflexota bacterium]
MHYFMIEAIPSPDNMEEQAVGGAYVNCWINFALADGAELLARHYIERVGWIPGDLHEHKIIKKSMYNNDDESIEYIHEAEVDGASFVFHTWKVDAESTNYG